MSYKFKEAQVELLSGIDSMIINGESIGSIFDFAENGLKDILNNQSMYIEYKSPYDVLEDDNGKLIATLNGNNERLYIKHIICNNINYNHPDVEVISLLKSIGRQLNIGINKIILEKTHELYSKTIHSLAIKYSPTGIMNHICSNLLNIFPDHYLFKYNFDSDICVQILSNLSKRNILVISGSTKKSNVGGTVSVSKSICGKLLQFAVCNNYAENDSDYHAIDTEGDKLFYYLGNPNMNNDFMHTTRILSCNEFDFIIQHKDNSYSIVNIESSSFDSFRKIHVNVIFNIMETLSVLLFSINQMKKRRTTTIYSIMRPYMDYVQNTIRIFSHNNSQPKVILDDSIDHLGYIIEHEKYDELREILSKLIEVKKQQTDVENLMLFSLRGMSTENTTSIQLEKVFEFIEKIIQEQIKESNIQFKIEIPKDFPPIFINNIFFQYLYTVVQNSISSITRKRDLISKMQAIKADQLTKYPKILELKESLDGVPYMPMIKLSVCAYDIYQDIELKSIPSGRDSLYLNKCKLEIYDNGMGIEEEKINDLGNHKASYTGGNGYALFALKQYLSCFNGQLLFSSQINKYFICTMILNFFNPEKFNDSICDSRPQLV